MGRNINWCRLLAYIPGLGAFLIPLVFWGSSLGRQVNIGGDVPNFLFLHPLAFLLHGALSSYAPGLSGYDTGAPDLSLAVEALVARSIHLNPQLTLAGVTLALTYLGAVMLAQELMSNVKEAVRLSSSVVAGAIAALAPMIAENFWTNFLFRVYLMPLALWSSLWLIRYLRSGGSRYLVALSLSCAAASAALSDIPGTVPVVIWVGLVVVAACGRALFARRALSRLVTVCMVVGISNLFWLFPFLAGFFLNQAQVVYATSSTATLQTVGLLRSLAPLQRAGDVAALQLSVPMLESYRWPQLATVPWLSSLRLIGYLPWLFIGGGILCGHRVKRHMGQLQLAVLATIALVFLGAASLTFPPGSLDVVLYLARAVPGWAAMRNFYETFAIPLALTVALAAAMGVAHIALALQKHWTSVLAAVVVVLGFAAYDLPLITGSYFRLPYYRGSAAERVVSALPGGYMSLVRDVRRLGGGMVVSLPLLSPDWTYLTGKTGVAGGTYIGISPMYYLSGIDNLVGTASFYSSSDPSLASIVAADLSSGRSLPLARVLEALGARWLLVDAAAWRQPDFASLSTVQPPSENSILDAKLLSDLMAKPIAHTQALILYRVGGARRVPFLSLDEKSALSEPRSWLALLAAGVKNSPGARCPLVARGFVGMDGVPSGSVRVRTNVALVRRCVLVLREPYSSGWTLQVVARGRRAILHSQRAYGYANGFVLPRWAVGRLGLTWRYAPGVWLDVGSWLAAAGCGITALVGSCRLLHRWRRARLASGSYKDENS